MNNNGIEKISNENVNNNSEEEKSDVQEEIQDDRDSYLWKLQRRINEMRKERKEAENDANMLGNRLNLLKEEENKVFNVLPDRHGVI